MQNRPATARTAVVIGAASGMGAATAASLHKQGYQVKVADLVQDRLDDIATKLGAQSFRVDVTDDATVAALAEGCREGIDALVISAGLSMSMAPFERIIDVNLGGTARVLKTLGPRMNNGGAAVCFASMAGHLIGPIEKAIESLLLDAATPGLGRKISEALPAAMRLSGMAYGLSKLGVLKLVQRMAVEWGKNGARVVSVSPGLIDTPMGDLERKAAPEAAAAIALAPIPRVGTADDVANVVAFLCSAEASYITGCDLLVDGGWVGAIQSATGDSPIARALAAGRDRN